jgi:hypothetical protein
MLRKQEKRGSKGQSAQLLSAHAGYGRSLYWQHVFSATHFPLFASIDSHNHPEPPGSRSIRMGLGERGPSFGEQAGGKFLTGQRTAFFALEIRDRRN